MLDALHAAVLAAVLRDGRDACTAAQMNAAANGAAIRRLAPGVAFAAVYASCICGAQNCPYYVVRYGRGPSRVLLATFGITYGVIPDTPLPRLVIGAHDSALVTVRTTYAYRGGDYVDVATELVRGDTGASKPARLPLRFTPGSRSARLAGTVAASWGDTYVFRARAGQRLVVDGVRAPLVLTLIDGATEQTIGTLSLGVPVRLPRDGAYALLVDGGGDSDIRYALRVTIR